MSENHIKTVQKVWKSTKTRSDYGQTYRPTDWQADRPTNIVNYRVACFPSFDLGPAVEWVASSRPLIEVLINEGNLKKTEVNEFERFVRKESMDEQKRIVNEFMAENVKANPDPIRWEDDISTLFFVYDGIE